MDDVASVRNENANLRKIRAKLLQWEVKDCPLAPLTSEQLDALDTLGQLLSETPITEPPQQITDAVPPEETHNDDHPKDFQSVSYKDLHQLAAAIDNTNDFLFWYDKVNNETHDYADEVYLKYLHQLEIRRNECDKILDQIGISLNKLDDLKAEYGFVSNKTSSLNTASEKLIEEQKRLNEISDEIHRRLYYFTQAEQLSQRLQSSTLSVASDSFRECLDKIDECLDYLRHNSKFKESTVFIARYKQCLSKAVVLMRNYVTTVMSHATEQVLTPKQPSGLNDKTSSDAAFALYYGKFQSSATKVKRVSAMIEERINRNPEYEQLLSEIHNCYLTERANVMRPAVDKSIKDLKSNNKGDHCSLMRSACAFLVHVCQDEHRLFYQFFSAPSDQLHSYLEGLCTVLYDTLRPYIIHINHLETLAEICSILRIEMLEEHVQQNPESLEAFGRIVFQLLQDVQERLVFRAHLYLQSDILNYNPSAGDLAYPDKLEMMESIALSLQEPMLRRSDSRSSMISSASSVVESVAESHYRSRTINSPADLHGMWYPTVRRTLVCLSRLYRCVDRPVFQGLSQEALKHCIQSVSKASSHIATNKSPIDGELFEIKHLLILREQIAPFRVDFVSRETSLDFSKVKTAAFGLLQKRKQLFSLGTNNALLEFLLDGTPQVKEHLLDSRKDVDRQLKMVCEHFIKDAVQMFVGAIIGFLDKAQHLLSDSASAEQKSDTTKVNYSLRQSAWASPQQISSLIQEAQRLIKSKLAGLQRSMQLYLSSRDTEFIIFRPIRNNIISTFVKLEQLLSTNGYSTDDMIIANCPSAEQISILLSSASILAEGSLNVGRKMSTSSNEGTTMSRKISFERKISVEAPVIEDQDEKEST